MSFDMNIVSAAVKKYKMVKSVYWLFFALLAATLARNLNKPTSSRKIDRTVIEKKSTIILIGLTEVLLVSSDQTS